MDQDSLRVWVGEIVDGGYLGTGYPDGEGRCADS